MSRDPWISHAPQAAAPEETAVPSSRILSVYLPNLAIELWAAQRAISGASLLPGAQLALITAGTNGPLVYAVNDAAACAGVVVGAQLGDMRARCPDLRIAAADLPAERAALSRLTDWAGSWALWAAVDGGDGLTADVTITAERFGGEAVMLAGIAAALARAGLTARLALAPAWAGAWALARFGADEGAICVDASALNALPVEALRLSPRALFLLRRLGLRQVGDLAAIPRASLVRRFEGASAPDNPLIRLDELRGRVSASDGVTCPPSVFRAEVRPDQPLTDPSPWLVDMLSEVCAQMALAGQGCRCLQLQMHRTDGARHALTVRTALPTHDAVYLLAQFADRPAAIAMRFDVAMLTLEATAIEALHPVPEGQPQPLDRLMPRALRGPKGAKLRLLGDGLDGARALAPDDVSLPRLGDAPPLPRAQPAMEPPVQLLVPPERIQPVGSDQDALPGQFIWRGRLLRLRGPAVPDGEAHVCGPQGSKPRCYFRIRDTSGQHLWIFRETAPSGPDHWFLHGIFQ